MNFSQGHSGTKVQCESCLFSQGKTPEFTKMGDIHELFVLPLSLVWFAGATPENLGSTTTQNLVVKFDGEICGGVLVENASDDFPSKRSSKISPAKLRRKFATNFAENFANFTLEIAGAYKLVSKKRSLQIHLPENHLS